MTLKQRIRYLLDGLSSDSAGLTFAEIEQRLPGVRRAVLRRSLREMTRLEQLIMRRADARVPAYRFTTGPKSIRILAEPADKGPAMQNGNQERVYGAIAAGHSFVAEIVEATGLTDRAVRNNARRLMQSHRIIRTHSEDDRHLVRYVLPSLRCVLGEYWRGVKPLAEWKRITNGGRL